MLGGPILFLGKLKRNLVTFAWYFSKTDQTKRKRKYKKLMLMAKTDNCLSSPELVQCSANYLKSWIYRTISPKVKAICTTSSLPDGTREKASKHIWVGKQWGVRALPCPPGTFCLTIIIIISITFNIIIVITAIIIMIIITMIIIFNIIMWTIEHYISHLQTTFVTTMYNTEHKITPSSPASISPPMMHCVFHFYPRSVIDFRLLQNTSQDHTSQDSRSHQC